MEGPQTFFQTLRRFLKGTADIDELMDLDKLIDSYVRKHPRNETLLIIEFKNNEELFELMDLSDDDVYFESMINSPYIDSDFYGWDTAKEDFLDGYFPYHIFNDENFEKMSSIASIIIGGEVDLNNREYQLKLNQRLLDLFPRQTDNIIDDYRYERNSEMQQDARVHVNRQLEDFFDGLNIEIWDKWDSIAISVGDLYSWYALLGRLNLSLREILEEIFKTKTKRSSIGGWYDVMYEFGNSDYFDSVSLNRNVEGYLDKILDEMESISEDKGLNLSEMSKLLERVTSKYPTSRWHLLPKDKEVKFRIGGVDFDSGKLIVNLLRRGTIKTYKFSEENFNNLLYQPSLFDFDELY